MRIMFHRKEQWDLTEGNYLNKTILAMHVCGTVYSRRVFVLWNHGFMGFGLHLTWKTY